MAVTKVKSSKPGLNVSVSTQPEAKTTVNVVPETTVAAGSTDAPVLETRESFLSRFRQLCTLSDEGKKYADTIVNYLQQADASGNKLVVKSISFDDPISGEGRAIIDVGTKSTVLLLFTESYTESSKVPITDRAPSIAKRLTGICEGNGIGTPNIVQMIIVSPEDYSRVERMANHVYNLFSAMANKGAYNVSLYKQLRLIPNNNVEDVKAFINKRSPHAVQDRVDWGVVMEIETGIDRAPGYINAETPLRTPVLAIGGYTKFIMHQDPMGLKIYPICLITNITSDIPVSGILNFAIPIAAGNAIVNGGWMQPYSTFRKDGPNLGSFFLDPKTGKPLMFTSAEQQQQSVIASFMPPVLGIDIPEGRAHIPELEHLYNTYGKNMVYTEKDAYGNDVKKSITFTVADEFLLKSADTFFGGKFNEFKISANGLLKPTAAVPWTNYEGSVKFPNNTEAIDTRKYDYLNLVPSLATVDEDAKALLLQYTDPALRMNLIKKRIDANASKITYRCTTVLFDSKFVSVLAGVLSTQVSYINAPSMGNMSIPLNTYISQQMSPITGTNSFFGGYSYPNQMANIYFKGGF